MLNKTNLSWRSGHSGRRAEGRGRQGIYVGKNNFCKGPEASNSLTLSGLAGSGLRGWILGGWRKMGLEREAGARS